MHGEFYSKHFSLEKIRDGIFAAIAKNGGGSVANAGFIDLGDQTILFDTFNTQQAAEDLKKFAEKITNRNITWVVNSHWHGDHIRGNQIFQESKIISSEITREKMKDLHPERMMQQKNGLSGLTAHIQSLKDQIGGTFDQKLAHQISFLSEIESSLPTLELTLPQQTFKNELTFHGTYRTAQLVTYGGGHSYCDAFLYIPEEKVIFLGDLLFVDTPPSLFDESNPEEWIKILKKIVDAMEIDVAVPGHGPVGNKENILDVVTHLKEH
ncbi:MBL fold metallo-hydrolase [Bacillus salipaludis]|uniref:MBL fold metallo-hydrolase n=1 Tax=Bacillus salipaludis TaxID=2547811 RepID=UPI003D23CE12